MEAAYLVLQESVNFLETFPNFRKFRIHIIKVSRPKLDPEKECPVVLTVTAMLYLLANLKARMTSRVVLASILYDGRFEGWSARQNLLEHSGICIQAPFADRPSNVALFMFLH